MDDCLIIIKLSQEEIENLTADYFLLKQGQLLTCEMWGKCRNDINFKDFHKESKKDTNHKSVNLEKKSPSPLYI